MKIQLPDSSVQEDVILNSVKGIVTKTRVVDPLEVLEGGLGDDLNVVLVQVEFVQLQFDLGETVLNCFNSVVG